MSEVKQGFDVGVDSEDNTSTLAAVASVGSALGHVLLSTEGDAAIAPLARFNLNFNTIYKAPQTKSLPVVALGLGRTAPGSR